jgi:hypothetical protein
MNSADVRADGEVAVEAAKVNSDVVAGEVNFNAAGNAATGAKTTDTEASAAETKYKGMQLADVLNVDAADKRIASNEVKPEAEADASKVIEANSRVPPTALQSASDMNSAEVVAAGEVVVDAAEVSSVTVTFNTTVVQDDFNTEARDHAGYGSLDNAEAKLQTQAFSAKVITASGCNLAYTATADAIAAKLTDSTAVEPLSADGEVAVEAAEVKSDVGAAKVNLFTAGDNFNVAGNATAGT